MSVKAGGATVIARQHEAANGYRSVSVAGMSSASPFGCVVTGKVIAEFELREGQAVELEQHSFRETVEAFKHSRFKETTGPVRRSLIVVSCQGGSAAVWWGRALGEGDGCRVGFENGGEGWDGEYNPADPEDENLLRLYVDEFDPEAGEFVPVDDASYCTRVRADLPDERLEWLLRAVHAEVAPALKMGVSIKKLMERLSWIHSDWYGTTIVQQKATEWRLANRYPPREDEHGEKA